MNQTQAPTLRALADQMYAQVNQCPQTPKDYPQACPLATEIEGTLMMALDFLEETAMAFQMEWLTGTTATGLLDGKTNGYVSPATLKAAMEQPGISAARKRMLGRLYEGQMAAEIVSQDTPAPELEPLMTVDRTTRASEQPVEVMHTFLDRLMAHLKRSWLKSPLLTGALEDLMDRRPEYLIRLMENPQNRQQLMMAPVLVTIATLEGLLDSQLSTIKHRLVVRRYPNLSELPVKERISIQTQMESEAASELGETIGSALQTSNPLLAMKDLNPCAAAVNLKSVLATND